MGLGNRLLAKNSISVSITPFLSSYNSYSSRLSFSLNYIVCWLAQGYAKWNIVPWNILFVFSSLPTSDFPSQQKNQPIWSLQNQEYIFLWQILGIFHFFHPRNFCLFAHLILSFLYSELPMVPPTSPKEVLLLKAANEISR